MNPFTHETNDNVEFLQPYPVVAANAMLETGTTLISAVLSFDATTYKKTPVSRNFITSRCVVVLFGTSLSGHALLNASRTAANDFDAKQCSRMNTRSTREYTMFAPPVFAQLS
jgi:hypothetical protein